MPEPLMSLSTHTLLTKFGKGHHKPGSGSASALLTLLSCKLASTVVQLSVARDKYAGVKQQLSLANSEILETYDPRLVHLFEQDSVEFHKVIVLRNERDAEQDKRLRKQKSEKHLDQLRIATDIPMEIAEISNTVAERALTVFDLGFKSARGDSTVAISSAIAGAMGAIGIVYLNLTSFQGGEWAVETRMKADAIASRTAELQRELALRVVELQKAALAKEGTTEALTTQTRKPNAPSEAPLVPVGLLEQDCDKCSGTGKISMQ